MTLDQVLEREIDRIRNAPQGERNATLNKVAYTLGGYAHLGLAESDALQAVHIAGQIAGLKPGEITTSFFSGWNHGKNAPCEMSTSLPCRDIMYDFDDNSIVQIDQIIDPDFLSPVQLFEPDAKTWNGKNDLIQYLQVVFQESDYVGYVITAKQNDDKTKWVPAALGAYDRTAGQLISDLRKAKTIADVIGDTEPEAGAWIRFNPLDGAGASDHNVIDYRYALVEGDDYNIERQAAIYEALQLPCAALVHSGKKSLHAIVRIDAKDLSEWRARVKYLYAVLEKNGLVVDKQNSNPSRLSRMPGIMRGEARQYLVATNTGKANWDAWKLYIEECNDNLPDFEPIENIWSNLPEKSPELIKGILRKGHKLLLAGPSKAGKSFLLLELAIAIAEGTEWIGFPVAQGKVLYVNLELDHASCLHRIKDLYATMGIEPRNLHNLVLWQLRGKADPLDKLAPHLIRRAKSGNYTAIIIDPLYKILTGDENSAHEMAKFCNNFDRICVEIGCSTIYCHHHSKGSQGQKKSGDRASGSGVFLRDPDALVDLIELDIDVKTQEEISKKYTTATHTVCPSVSAWRIEGTLREFAPFGKVNILFDYPRHYRDESTLLEHQKADGEQIDYPTSKKERIRNAVKAIEGDLTEGVRIDEICLYAGLDIDEVTSYCDNKATPYSLSHDGFIRLKSVNRPKELLWAYQQCAKNGAVYAKNMALVMGKSKESQVDKIRDDIKIESKLFQYSERKPVQITAYGQKKLDEMLQNDNENDNDNEPDFF